MDTSPQSPRRQASAAAILQLALSATLALLFLGSPSLAVADAAKAPQEALKAWQQMTPQQRAELRRRWRQFKRLSPAKRARMLRRLRQFQAMSPAERARIERNRRAFQRLSTAQKRRILRNYRRFRLMPKAKRRRIGFGSVSVPRRSIEMVLFINS